ncbi:MAG: hypothetical protein LBT16_07575 [Treponema sp.]|jgi:hypothetical protein|nr:hypothetical protein [Treponema sp.]
MRRKPLILLLIKRFSIFFSLMTLLSIFLYSLGTIQEFTDFTQLFLLRETALFSLISGCVAAYGFFLNVFFFFWRGRLAYRGLVFEARRRVRFLISAFFYIVLAPLSFFVSFAFDFILTLTGGNIS